MKVERENKSLMREIERLKQAVEVKYMLNVFFTWKIRPEARLNLIRKGTKVINIMEKLINGQTWYMKTKKYIFNLLHILVY